MYSSTRLFSCDTINHSHEDRDSALRDDVTKGYLCDTITHSHGDGDSAHRDDVMKKMNRTGTALTRMTLIEMSGPNTGTQIRS